MDLDPKFNLFSTTVICTIGRTSLGRSVDSVLSQDEVEGGFEVIVVNDSGRSLEAAPWQRSDRVTILHTNRHERCAARNVGAAIARGAYLHFLDDDDWLLPGALKRLQTAAQTAKAAIVYGTSRLFDIKENIQTDHHINVAGNGFVQLMAGEWLPLGASLIRTDVFFQAGGFDQRFFLAEDKDLCRRIALHHDLVPITHPVVFMVRDLENSSTNYDLTTAASVYSRDDLLEQREAFRRMLESARTSYWRGKAVRACLTCAATDLYKSKFCKALSRAGAAIAIVIRSAADLASLDFWKALVLPIQRKHVW